MTDNERDKIINEIASDVRLIKDRLERDFRTLYGNGRPRLVDDVAQAKTDIELIKQSHSIWRTLIHYVGSILSGGIVAWLTAKICR